MATLPESERPLEHEEHADAGDELRQLREELAGLRELRSLTNELVGLAAHDLRGSLDVARGALQLLRERSDDAELREALLAQVEGATERSLTVAGHLLDDAVLASGQWSLLPRIVDLSDLLGAERELLARQAARRGHRLVLEAPDGPVFAPADPERLELAVRELIENALGHARVGSDVRLTVRTRGNDALLAVSNDGPAIPRAERERMFKPFVRGARAGDVRGAGLGLASVKRTVLAHGGHVELTCSRGRTTFTLVIPRRRSGHGRMH